MMGLSTETFFMMMLKMMWFRDVVGLIVKGLLFGALPAAICCYEGLWPAARAMSATAPRDRRAAPGPRAGAAAERCPFSGPPACRCVAILIMNSSWFMLVYHAVPFYGPTLLPPPGP